MLDRDSILGAMDLTPTTLEIPEWGGEVWIRTMSGVERDMFDRRCMVDQKNGSTPSRAFIASLVLCDERGKRIFSEKDTNALEEKSGSALDRIFQWVAKHCLLGEGGVQEAAKN